MPQVWTSLFDTGVNDNNDEARDHARRGILKMIDEVDGDDQLDILTSDKIVAFLARAFEDGWKEAASVFDLLDDTKKIQVRVLHAARPYPVDAHPLCCSLTLLPMRAVGLPHAESKIASTP